MLDVSEVYISFCILEVSDELMNCLTRNTLNFFEHIVVWNRDEIVWRKYRPEKSSETSQLTGSHLFFWDQNREFAHCSPPSLFRWQSWANSSFAKLFLLANFLIWVMLCDSRLLTWFISTHWHFDSYSVIWYIAYFKYKTIISCSGLMWLRN